MKNDITKTLIKVAEETIDNAIDLNIRLPQLNKEVWLGNYHIKFNLGGNKNVKNGRKL